MRRQRNLKFVPPLLPLLTSVQILFEPSVSLRRARLSRRRPEIAVTGGSVLIKPATRKFKIGPPFVTFATFCSNPLRTFCEPSASALFEATARNPSNRRFGVDQAGDAQVQNRFSLCYLCCLLFKSSSNLL